MGKIVKNGVTYSGSSDNADNVKYNNNASNLDATNVQEAIDKLDESVDTLNSNLAWKLAGSVTGTTHITLPQNFSELSIKLQNGNREYLFISVPRSQLSTEKIDCIIGYSLGNNETYIEYYLSKSEFNIVEAKRIGQDTTSTSSAEIWYK